MTYLVFIMLFVTSQVWGADRTDGAVSSISTLFDQELYSNVLDPQLCSQHLVEMNTFNFYDVSFRIPQGILQGNVLNYGLYQQCLDLRQEVTEDNVIEGKHCMINVPLTSLSSSLLPSSRELLSVSEEIAKKVIAVRQQFTTTDMLRDFDSQIVQNIGIEGNQGLTFRLGVCIPKSCSVRQALDQYLNNSIVSVDYEESVCRLPNDRPYRGTDYVAIVVFSMIGLVTIISTSYDLFNIYFLKNDPKDVNKLYSCCSVYTNSRRLFTFTSTPGAITCLDGIRAISIIWVIIGHTALVMTVAGISNLMDLMEWYSTPKAIWLWAAEISVDSFFMMSGLLLVYSSANKVTQSLFLKKLHLYYLNRFLRMFPVVATAVFFQATLLFHLSDGPNWTSIAPDTISCQRYWWAALFHVQNYVNPNRICLGHLWYLSVDFQLHILSPLVLYWALGSRRQGWTAVTVALLASLTASTIYCYLTDFNATPNARHNKYYVNTLTRAPPFLVGLFYGYLLHVYRGKKLQLPRITIICGWVFSLTLLSLVIYVYYPQMQDNNETLADFLDAFRRTIWAIGLGILVFVCNHNHGGPINWFLSLTVWKFISRISFAMYVLHFPMQFFRMATTTAPHYFSGNNLMLRMIEDVVLSIMLSIVVCIVIDAPFSILIKVFLNKGPRKETSEGIVNAKHNEYITTETNDKKDIKEASYDKSDNL